MPRPTRTSRLTSGTTALRQEAERKWARSDEKTARRAAKGLKRRKTRTAKRQFADERDAQIVSLKAQLARSQKTGRPQSK